MLLPGRDTFDPQYRFGFNGKENDLDFRGVGQITDYGARIYNARLGKFLSVDPIIKKYPELTPYQFASNSPIENIDLDGLEKLSIHFKVEDGRNIITKVETNNSIRYWGVDAFGVPIKSKIVEFIEEDKNRDFIRRSGDIPLKNYGGTLYVGPFNPRYENGTKKGQYRYDYPAINLLDLAGKNHDKGYDGKQAAGPFDAVYLLKTLELDRKLVGDAQKVVDLYNEKKVDPINKLPISDETAAAAKGVVNIFSKIVKEKTIRLEIINAVNSIQNKSQQAIDKTKDAINQFSRDLNNMVPIPH